MGIAHQLNKSAKARARLALPRINRMAESQYNDIHFDVPIQGSPHRVFQMEGGRDAGGRDHPLHALTAADDSCTLLVRFPPADAAVSHARLGPMLLVAALFAPIATIALGTPA